MDYQVNLYAFVLLFAFLQGLFYVYQFCKRGFSEERVSDFWLAGLILALCIAILPSMLGFMGIYILGQAWWFFPQDTGLIIGPLVYFYLKSQTNVQFKFQTRDYWHFLPYGIYFFYHLLVFLNGKDGIDWWAQSVHNRLYIGMWERIAENGSLLVYMVLSLRLYQHYRRWLPTERSDIESIRLGWYQHFLALVVVGVLAAIVWFLLGLFIPLSYQEDWILRAIVAFNICYISFNGYIQVQPHRLTFDTSKLSGPDAAPNHPEVPAKKVERPDPAEVQTWCKKVEAIMQGEKLYLNPELTLSELAEKLQTHNSWISYVINTGFQKNFNDFVNAYRVADFQKKVNDPRLSHYTLLAIAFECGFNSKSTFNRAVKKATGQLPSTFGTKTQQ